jgi:hypothetical protein
MFWVSKEGNRISINNAASILALASVLFLTLVQSHTVPSAMHSFVALSVLSIVLVSLPFSVQSRFERTVFRRFEAQHLPSVYHVDLLLRYHRRWIKVKRIMGRDEDKNVDDRLDLGAEFGKRGGSRFTFYSPGL